MGTWVPRLSAEFWTFFSGKKVRQLSTETCTAASFSWRILLSTSSPFQSSNPKHHCRVKLLKGHPCSPYRKSERASMASWPTFFVFLWLSPKNTPRGSLNAGPRTRYETRFGASLSPFQRCHGEIAIIYSSAYTHASISAALNLNWISKPPRRDIEGSSRLWRAIEV